MRGAILVVRHGRGRGRKSPYMDRALEHLAVRRPELHASLCFWKTGEALPSLSGVAAIVFWLADDELLEPGERETGIFAAVARRHRQRGYAERLSVLHAAALSAQPPDERRRVSALLAEAQVAAIVCPRSALGMVGLDRPTHLHNCIAPLHDFLAECVLVALGTDNINDVFVPFSRGDLIEELDFIAEAVRFYDLDTLADIASRNGAEVLGLSRTGPSWRCCSASRSSSASTTRSIPGWT